MKVVKRDGRVEDFSLEKVKRAVEAALLATGMDPEAAHHTAVRIGQRTFKLFMTTPVRHVEDFHREVENLLMEEPLLRDAARAYIEYRHDRDNAREGKGKLYADITGFLDQSAEEFTRENANKPSTVVNTHRDLLAGILSKHVALTQILPKNLAEWHTEGFGHIHDLDYLVSPLTNCCLVNYRDMLENGFKIGNAKIEKPKSIGVATTVLTQIIQAVASSQYGGQTCAHIDEGLKQYVEMSFMKNVKQFQSHRNAVGPTNKMVYDAMQTLLYQVNTLMSVNGQSPFITISLGLDTSMFGRMITYNYLKVHKEGLGADKVTPVFPKVVFFLKEGVNMNPGDPNYDLKLLAMECCAERIYPDFISVPLNMQVTGSSDGKVTSMGCRSFLSHFATENGEKYDGRFNLGVVSLNLPMIAAEAKAGKGFFTELLDKHMEMAYEAHMLRVGRLMDVTASQNPTLFMEGALARLGPDEKISKLFYDGYASISIGFVGLYEAVEILYDEPVRKEMAMNILKYMKDICAEFKERSGLGFSLYGTPAESLCYRFASKLQEKHPGLIERDYLTNSFHQPVWLNSDPFSKWDYESGFAEISNGGNIGYVETPNLKHNMQALEALINYGYENIHYFGINQPVDQCFKCGFSGEFKATAKGFECPSCGNHEEGTISVIRRVSGYLSAPNSRPYNKGKMEEVLQRVKHV
ncbi:anaerobic ribonucleoside-triphosphate reductase [Salmonella phage PVPSE1]|uniref:Anaerobic ribonucleoside-triphosphate reductase n=2 Tax=Seunavirus TaxID=1914851 RepID=G3BM07_9CAUD|nr:NrdD-like anaerobic ribonucleotide reductase large subunit [Salmonella phage PVPSE1]YP_009148981.1 NrdD-like anaerobic ribonucleotide reductase large subunit [Salmonella phage SSE121]ADP02537.1 anaerobic ribonucleoside-triphosphate reductase [Salmonella phage PVPSE1]AFU63826.1 ribonucleotide reductase of class III (anaerobic) large subunit [Salmonella phage SSE121]